MAHDSHCFVLLNWGTVEIYDFQSLLVLCALVERSPCLISALCFTLKVLRTHVVSQLCNLGLLRYDRRDAHLFVICFVGTVDCMSSCRCRSACESCSVAGWQRCGWVDEFVCGLKQWGWMTSEDSSPRLLQPWKHLWLGWWTVGWFKVHATPSA